jgi:RNA recognition motif-containing protein
MDVNLVRDQTTGKSKGFAFLAYEDQRSTVLAVGESASSFDKQDMLSWRTVISSLNKNVTRHRVTTTPHDWVPRKFVHNESLGKDLEEDVCRLNRESQCASLSNSLD